MLRTCAARAGLSRVILQQRGFAEKAVAQEFDWDAFGALVHSDEGKRELQTLRSTYLDIKQRLTSMAKAPEPIDWAAWKKELDPKLVDEFKTAYETMKLPSYQGNEAEEAKAKFAALIREAEGLVSHSEQRSKEIQAEINSIRDEKARIATATIDDELAADPKLAEEIDKEVASQHFLVT